MGLAKKRIELLEDQIEKHFLLFLLAVAAPVLALIVWLMFAGK